MEIAITGASGLVGSALSESLAAAGHRPIAMVRRSPTPGADEIAWDPVAGTIDAGSLAGLDAVVHLAGAGIGDHRWSEERKRLLLSSRVKGTSLLAETLAGLDRPPAVLISGSAIGFYGDRGNQRLDETAEAGSGFLADLVTKWEAAAQPAIDAGIRTVLARTGLVLSPNGGMLAKQLPLFKLGLGGRFGSGVNHLAWISLADEVRAIEFALATDLLSGPVNLVAPYPVTNLEFTKTLGAVLRRPTLIPVPLLGPRLLFGKEFVAEAILVSQRVQPTALTQAGFEFDYPTLELALRSML